MSTTKKIRTVPIIKNTRSVASGHSAAIGLIAAVSHPTHKILKIFEPIIFQIAISVCFLSAAITDVASSGTDVPIATILAPISTVETLKSVASCTE